MYLEWMNKFFRYCLEFLVKYRSIIMLLEIFFLVLRKEILIF